MSVVGPESQSWIIRDGVMSETVGVGAAIEPPFDPSRTLPFPGPHLHGLIQCLWVVHIWSKYGPFG